MQKEKQHLYGLGFQGLKLLILAGLLVLPFKWPRAIPFASKPSANPSLVEEKKALKAPASDPNPFVQVKKAHQLLEATLPDNPFRPQRARGWPLSLSPYFSSVVPEALRPAVDFWKLVYTHYDRNTELIHDTEDLGIIYSVLRFDDLERLKLSRSQKSALRQQRIDAEKERIRRALLKLDEKRGHPETYTEEESALARLFEGDYNPYKFQEAATEGRIRSQTGLKSQFKNAIVRSGAYLPQLEAIFRDYGLPVELTRMVFVESMFDPRAESKVGAYGLWQLMPNTAKLFGLNIDGMIDERGDLEKATHAAAQLLAENYRALQSWPLAINAYNSGVGTLQAAVRQTGSRDIATIIHGFRGGVYGFASRNFYPSFLAALEAYRDYPRYFGNLRLDSPQDYRHYTLRTPGTLRELCAKTRLDCLELRSLNPQLREDLFEGPEKLQPGQALRIPSDSEAKLLAAENRALAQAL